MRLYSSIKRVKSHGCIERHIEIDLPAGSHCSLLSHEMSSALPKSVSKRLSEKDGGGNDSEPELSTFSNLNISTKPLHTRPSRGLSKEAAKTEAQIDKAAAAPVGNADAPREEKGFTRCLRPRLKQTNGKGSGNPEPRAAVSKTERGNNNSHTLAQRGGTTPAQYACCDNNNLGRAGTLLTMTLSQVPRNKARSRAFDASSLYSATSDDFNESDDELISINGDCSSEYSSLSLQSPRISSKRKRTTTLSADLEVASLLSPSGDDCMSSGDNFSVSDYSEPDEPSCNVPRKRLCGGATPGDDRPFLDLEKMQDEVEKSALLSNKRRPRAIRIMCFSPITGLPGRPTTRSQFNSREMVLATQFCPLPSVEYSADGYS